MTGTIEGLSHEFQFDRRASEPMDQQNPNPSSVKQDMPIIALEFCLRTHAQLSHSVDTAWCHNRCEGAGNRCQRSRSMSFAARNAHAGCDQLALRLGGPDG
jgi:hypothetical protein